jgi:hypothetical protein
MKKFLAYIMIIMLSYILFSIVWILIAIVNGVDFITIGSPR